MADAKFTPGPWVCHKDSPTDVICSTERDCSLATIDHGCGDHKEWRANAHLIAASPELYRSLVDLVYSAEYLLNFSKSMSEFEGNIGVEQGCIDRARAALAKARGETP